MSARQKKMCSILVVVVFGFNLHSHRIAVVISIHSVVALCNCVTKSCYFFSSFFFLHCIQTLQLKCTIHIEQETNECVIVGVVLFIADGSSLNSDVYTVVLQLQQRESSHTAFLQVKIPDHLIQLSKIELYGSAVCTGHTKLNVKPLVEIHVENDDGNSNDYNHSDVDLFIRSNLFHENRKHTLSTFQLISNVKGQFL